MKRNKWLLILLAAIVFGVIGYLNWPNILKAWDIAIHVQWQILLLIPVIQFLGYYVVAKYYQAFFDSFKYKVKTGQLYELSLALNFVNQILPSASVSGIAFLIYGLKGQVPPGKVTLAQLGRFALTYLTFSVLLAVAVMFLYFGGGITKITVRILIILVVWPLILSPLIFYNLGSRKRFERMVRWINKMIARFSRKILRRKDPVLNKDKVTQLLEEFYHGFELVTKERNRLRRPAVYALLANFLEVTTLYIVFLALGVAVNPGAIIISYAVASGVGIISLLPGDVGVYEATIIAMLASAGVPLELSIASTLVYRLITKITFLPIGFYFYSKYIGRRANVATA